MNTPGEDAYRTGFSAEENPDARSFKRMPHSVEAEQSVLGGVMIDNASWEMIVERCSVDDFYIPQHRTIFETMQRLSEQSKPLDVITLQEELDRHEQLDEIGGLPYLGSIADNTPSTANIVAYADIVHERAMLRKLINVSTKTIEKAYNPEGLSALELMLNAEQTLSSISDDTGNKGDGPKEINPLLTSAVERIDELFNSDGGITGVTTGFRDLDEQTSGLQKADLVIVAGRPSMGKTTFAMNLVENALMGTDRPVLVFSMEMPAESIVLRMLSSIGRIDQTKVRNGKLEEDDWPKLSAAISQMKDKPLYIDDTPALNPVEMRARVRKIYRKHNDVALIMVDYLQLMRGSSENSGGRTQEISEISRSLKEIAKEFNCPLIALSQLNRGLEQRPNKRPVMSDLRESGAIEQDADIIAFIYRDEVYNEDSPDKGVAEIIIGKQRNGPIGTTRLAFIGKYTRFENLAHGSYEEY